MPSLTSAAIAAGWCPVCYQTGHKHTKECTPEKRKAYSKKMTLIVLACFVPVIVFVAVLALFSLS